MNLINLYIDEVIRRLPDDAREDIALELESTIYDMLPDDYEETDVKETLATLGHPAVLASKYSDRPMHLIGPKYYDLYMSLLKMIAPIAVIVVLIATISEVFFTTIQPGEILSTIITLFSQAIWTVINVFIQTFFWLTLIFAIIEYSDKTKDSVPISMRFKPWTPDDLTYMKHVPKQKMIKKFEIFFGLLWMAIWVTVYFYADHLIGIYEGGADGLRMVTPAFNQEVLMSFWPVVIVVVAAEIALTAYKMIEKQWTRRLATFYSKIGRAHV